MTCSQNSFCPRGEAEFAGWIFVLLQPEVPWLWKPSEQALERLKNHIQTSFPMWESSSSQNRTQTRVPRQTLAVPAQEEPAQHPIPPRARDTGQRFPDLHPSPARNTVMLPTEPTCFVSEIPTICSALPVSSRLPINQPLKPLH